MQADRKNVRGLEAVVYGSIGSGSGYPPLANSLTPVTMSGIVVSNWQLPSFMRRKWPRWFPEHYTRLSLSILRFSYFTSLCIGLKLCLPCTLTIKSSLDIFISKQSCLM